MSGVTTAGSEVGTFAAFGRTLRLLSKISALFGGLVFVALVANTSTRLVTAWVSGGLAYALRVGSALLAGLLAALAAGVLAA